MAHVGDRRMARMTWDFLKAKKRVGADAVQGGASPVSVSPGAIEGGEEADEDENGAGRRRGGAVAVAVAAVAVAAAAGAR
jgi:outer membrane scaffolding protein for murein synthesis (MipA/OmpV family)